MSDAAETRGVAGRPGARDGPVGPSGGASNGAPDRAVPIPRRGRLRVLALLIAALALLGYALVDIATRPPGSPVVRVDGVSDAQRIFGGVHQEGDRLGSSDAPVTIQVFNDLQCSSCREEFLSTIPALVEAEVRPGDVKLLYRHYSVASTPEELGFYGAEAAAQQGYGWQYTYLFFRNQDEAKRHGVDDRFLASIAGGVEELDEEEWQSYLDEEGGPGGAISRRLGGYERLGADLGIRTGQAAVVSGPGGTRTLQEGPSLAQIERAIAEVG